VVMVVVMIVVMVMMIVIMVMMIMIMVIMIMVIVFVVVMMHVGRHDTCQADRVMWMVGAVTAAIVLCRGRSREERHYAETSYRGSSKNEGVTGHGCSLQKQCRNVLGQALFPAI
jgi:type IV secretory pathway VirB3-like protein